MFTELDEVHPARRLNGLDTRRLMGYLFDPDISRFIRFPRCDEVGRGESLVEPDRQDPDRVPMDLEQLACSVLDQRTATAGHALPPASPAA